MKKISLFTVIILILLPFFLIGCGEDEPESMTFIDDPGNTRQFTINELLEFNVKFIGLPDDPDIKELFETLPGLGVGGVVNGKVKGTKNKWRDAVISGSAQEMKSNNSELTGILKDLIGSIEIKLEYLKVDGSIVGVIVDFPGDEAWADASSVLMGGTYLRK